jgi:hypothetical protein
MSPFLIFGIVAGAYLIGRRAKAKPAPLALPEGASLQDVSELWVGRNDIEIYPPNAPTNFSPPAPDGIVADAGCNVIAIADGWWDALGDHVKTLTAEGPELYTSIVNTYIPSCKGKETLAHKLVRFEVMERLTPAQAVIMNPGVITAQEAAHRHHRRRGLLGALRGNPRRKPGALATRWGRQ